MNASIADRTLWDCLGNKCRVEMFRIGQNEFEVYFHRFNSAVPTRHVGALGECNARVDAWLSCRMAEGYQEQLPSYNPEACQAISPR